MKHGAKIWTELSRERLIMHYGRGLEKRSYQLPHGTTADFYLTLGQSTIACLALTGDRKVIMGRQFRPGPNSILLELPGGAVDEGEGLIEATERELLEETGYRGRVEYVGSVVPSAYATYLKHALIAFDCEQVAEPKVESNGEEIEVELITLEELRAHIRTGQMTDVDVTYLCLDKLGLL